MKIKDLSKRDVFLDLVKVIAIFLVIANHCVDNVTAAQRSEPWYNLWGSFYNTFSRPSIPLFVMVSGILLMPVKMKMGEFYTKKISRLIIPFLFWSVLYNLFPWFTGLLNLDPSVINIFFKWVEPTQELMPALKNIAMIPFTFTYFDVQMWYVYMLIGLYLYIPIFSAWVEKSTKNEQRIFLGIWFISMFIPYLRNYLVNNLWGVCSWNEFGMFYYFAGFSGYLLLGYHLVKHPLQISNRSRYLLATLSFVIGYLVTFVGFKNITAIPGQSEAMVELFFTFCSPNAALMSFGLFIALQNIEFKGGRMSQLIVKVSEASFGIWMCHYLFVGPVYLLVHKLPFHVLVNTLITNIITIILSFLLVVLIRKTGKFGRKIIG